jgi:hypothetical protein
MPQTALSILTGGSEDADKFFKLVGADEAARWHVVNLCEHLFKDPGTAVGHKEDYMYPRTQQCVISQRGFPDLIEVCLRIACGLEPMIGLNGTDGSNKMFMMCRSGFHRASVVGKIMESYANKIADDDGGRRFNCMRFSLHNVTKSSDFKSVIDRAVKWAASPWTDVAYTGDKENDVFGFEACQSHPEAWSCWKDLYARVQDGWKAIDHDLGVSSVSAGSASDGRGDDGRKQRPGGATWRHLPQSTKCPPPRPPPRPPIAPPPCVLLRRPATPPRHAVDALDALDDVDDDADDRLIPEWATTTTDVEVWWQSFDRWEVDTNARKALYALAQYSVDGYQKANGIIGKLIKKDTDADLPRNTSAFVHSSVMHARNELDPWHGREKRARHH